MKTYIQHIYMGRYVRIGGNTDRLNIDTDRRLICSSVWTIRKDSIITTANMVSSALCFPYYIRPQSSLTRGFYSTTSIRTRITLTVYVQSASHGHAK